MDRRIFSLCRMLTLLSAFWAFEVGAVAYSLPAATFSACTGSWNAATHTCGSRVVFQPGDTLTVSTALTIRANAGFELQGNNSLGVGGATVSLVSTYGDIAVGTGSRVNGSLTSGSGTVELTGAHVEGNVEGDGIGRITDSSIAGDTTFKNGLTALRSIFSGAVTVTNGTANFTDSRVVGEVEVRNVLTAQGSEFGSTVTATNGSISLSGGSVAGRVTTNCCTVTTNQTNLEQGITAHSGISITGGVIAGDFVMTTNNNISLTGVVMTSGSIDAFNIRVSDSDLGSAENPVSLTANGNRLDILNGSTVYGSVVVDNRWGKLTIDSPSAVYGSCLAESTPNTNNNVNGECGEGVPAPSVHHYELNYKSSALTCQPHEVTIKACANADCSSTYTEGPSRLSLSPAGWDTAVFSFVGSATGYLSVRKEGSVNLGIAGIPEPAPQHPLTCRVDEVLSTSCSLMFSKSAFIVTVQDFVSGSTVPASIQAVKADPADPAVCTPAFDSGTRTLDLWFSYVNPTATKEQGHQPVTLDGKALGLSPSSYSLTFAVSEDGERAVASIGRLGYVEAGRVKLNVRYSGVDAEAGLEMEGAEDFIVRPANLEVLAIGAPACNPEVAFCDKFKAAGDSFNLMIKARNLKNDVLKNFEHKDVKLEVLSEPGADKFYPRGGNPPKVVPVKYDHVFSDDHPADGAIYVETKVDEVGVVKIRAIAEKYLGSDKAVSGVSNFIGRFFPDHFKIEIVKQEQGRCGFSYAGLKGHKNGEPFTLEAQFTAYSKFETVTQNYQSEYAFLSDSGIKFEPYEDGELFKNGQFKFESHPVQFHEGVAEFVFPKPYMEFFNEHKRVSVQLNLSAEDLDEVRGEVRGTEKLEFRLGRLRIDNAHGIELQTLELPVRAEYFDGQGYRRNELDSCTRFDPAVADAFEPSAPGGTVPVLSYPEANKDSGSGEYRLKAGYGAYLLSAPGVSGSQTIRFNNLPNWLKHDWDGTPGLDSPSGLATFGIYKGNDKIIFRREIIGR